MMGAPPFAPFMQDPQEAELWRGGRQRMSEAEIGEVVRNHFQMLFTWAPYAEDYYRLNYLSRSQTATRQQTHYLYQHKPICDCAAPFCPRETFGIPGYLGRLAPASTKKPRQTVQLFEHEDGKLFEVDSAGEMQLSSGGNLLMAIERAYYWVLDIEDFDRLASSFTPASRTASQPVLDQFLVRRTAAAKNLVSFFLHTREIFPGFPTELLSITKGAELFARALRVLPPEHRAAVASVYVGALGAIATGRAAAAVIVARGGADPVSSALRKAQVEAARLTSEVLRRAGPPGVAAAIREMARFPPAAWPDLLRLPEALLVVGTVLHRGVELNLHVGATAGSDVISRLTAALNAVSTSTDSSQQQPPQQLQQSQEPLDNEATAAWREAFPFVYRGILDALHALTLWRMAATSTVPPAPAPPPFPNAVWDILVGIALVASLEQREAMRNLLGAVVACGGLEQNSQNPAVSSLHQLLMRSS